MDFQCRRIAYYDDSRSPINGMQLHRWTSTSVRNRHPPMLPALWRKIPVNLHNPLVLSIARVANGTVWIVTVIAKSSTEFASLFQVRRLLKLLISLYTTYETIPHSQDCFVCHFWRLVLLPLHKQREFLNFRFHSKMLCLRGAHFPCSQLKAHYTVRKCEMLFYYNTKNLFSYFASILGNTERYWTRWMCNHLVPTIQN